MLCVLPVRIFREEGFKKQGGYMRKGRESFSVLGKNNTKKETCLVEGKVFFVGRKEVFGKCSALSFSSKARGRRRGRKGRGGGKSRQFPFSSSPPPPSLLFL